MLALNAKVAKLIVDIAGNEITSIENIKNFTLIIH